MREILFRGKLLCSGKWVEGDLLQYLTMTIIQCRNETERTVRYEKHLVETSTVGQFTGLCDRNGKRIFEGDYVICRQAINGNQIDELMEIGYVEMKHGAFGLHRKQGYYRPFKDWLEDYEYEVIGNIYDNQNLIAGGGEDGN